MFCLVICGAHKGSRHGPVPCAWQPDSADPLESDQPDRRDPQRRFPHRYEPVAQRGTSQTQQQALPADAELGMVVIDQIAQSTGIRSCVQKGQTISDCTGCACLGPEPAAQACFALHGPPAAPGRLPLDGSIAVAAARRNP